MRRGLTISLVVAIGGAMISAVFLRQNRITTLKAERTQVLARLADPAEVSPTVAPAEPLDFKQNSHSPSIELLKLRAEVTRLGNRKHELANARVESERLHGQLATRGTNAPGGVPLPAGYLRKSEARNVGYATPEATIQSLLWAIQNRDSSSLLQAFGPENAKELKERMQSPASTEAFFKEVEVWPGMHVLGRESGPDGTEVLTVEIIPGLESKQQLRFKQLEGQWKLVDIF
jgi:hypothetical protein